MTGWQRFRQARMLLAGTTIALLTAVWSVLALHDLRPGPENDPVNASPAVTTSPQQVVTDGTTSTRGSQAATPKTTTTHTRTRAS
jgi:hypothetical protein